VGDGKSVKIWGDKWIGSTYTGKIQAPVRILGENDKVSALIDDTTQWWNYELIQAIFPENEAKGIYSTILSPLAKPDQIVWAGTKKRNIHSPKCIPFGKRVIFSRKWRVFHCRTK
jgi:hypothetical protein